MRRPGRVLEDAELLDGAGADAQFVTLSQQGAGLDEAQGQALGLEVEVARPVRLLLGEDAAHGALQDLHGTGPAQAAEEDLLDGGGRGRHQDLRGRGDQEGALGRRVEQFVEGGAAELDVVEDDDRADLPHQGEQFLPVGPVQGRVVDGVEEVVEQVGGGAVEAGEADHAVGGEVQAVLGDEVEQAGAPGARRAGEAYGTTAGEQSYQTLALLLAFQERQRGPVQAGRYGRFGRAVGLGTFGGAELRGPAGPLPGRAGLDLAAVDGVDGEQEVAGDQLHGAGECGCVLAEVGCEGFPGRALTRGRVVDVMAVLLGSPVDRVHRSKPPKSVVCGSTGPRPLPALLHTALSLLVRARSKGCHTAGDRTLNLRTVSTTGRGTAPSETSQSREDCARRMLRGHLTGPLPGSVTLSVKVSHSGKRLHPDTALDGQDAVQPGGHEQALHLRRHAAQHQAAAAAAARR